MSQEAEKVCDPPNMMEGVMMGQKRLLTEVVEEWWANQFAYVAELDRTPCVYEGYGFTSNAGDISKLVALDVPIILAFAEA